MDSSVPPKTTLLDYIREYTPHKGTKRLCNEGGCGVCTVVATFKDQETGKEKTCSVKSVSVDEGNTLAHAHIGVSVYLHYNISQKWM